MKLSLRDRLVRYLKAQQGWIHSGDLQRIVAEKTTYTPQNVGRRLRELENEHIIEVKYEKGAALYRFKEGETLESLMERQEQWYNNLK